MSAVISFSARSRYPPPTTSEAGPRSPGEMEIKRCPISGWIVRAPFPKGVSAPTQYGPNFRGLMVYEMSCSAHASGHAVLSPN